MKLLDQLKKSIADTTGERAAIQEKINWCHADISGLESTPLPPEDASNILSRMVDKAAERHRSYLIANTLQDISVNSDVSGLRCSIEEKGVLNPLFNARFDPSGFAGEPTVSTDALCYFFGDLIKTKFADLCGNLETGSAGVEYGSPFIKRIEEIDAANATLKALELQEEDVAAAMDEARVLLESLPGL